MRQATRATAWRTVLVATLAVAGGCADSYEKLVKDQAAVTTELADALDSIKDAATAKAAAPRLKELGAKMREVQARRDKLPAPTPAERQAMPKELEEPVRRLQAAFKRISSDPALRAVAAEAVKDMGSPARPM